MKRTPLLLDTLIWSFILVGWGGWILFLLASGGMLKYLHPRMLPYAVLSSVIFIALGLLGIFNAFWGRGKRVLRAGYAVFLIPLLLSSVGGARGLDEGAVLNRILSNAGGGSARESLVKSLDELLESIGPEGIIPFEDWSFYNLSSDLNSNPSRYQGRTISMTGFSFRPANLPNDRLYLTRFLITCCVADAEPLGLLTELTEASKLADYTWLRIEGVIDLVSAPNPYTGKNEEVPILRAVTAVEVEKPIAAYIFPVDI